MYRARDRTVLSDQQVVLNHWAEHLTELLDASIIPERDAKSEDLVVSIEELLKIDKAPGGDSISAELLKFAEAELSERIYEIISQMWGR